MFNLISALVVSGVLSASGMVYLNQMEDHSKVVTKAYVNSAEQRFKDYESMLPGIVEWPKVADDAE